jgi:hypothetical protein
MMADRTVALPHNLRRLLANAFGAGLIAFLFGLCLVRTVKQFDSLFFASAILSAALLVVVLLWTRVAVKERATSETAKKGARQFLFSCLFFSLVCAGLGFAVAGAIWNSGSFQTFSVVFYGGIVGAGIYCVLRDAKRLSAALI